jgi:hypothetical protein
MPYRWVPIKGNPGAKDREAAVRKAAEENNGKCVFVGFDRVDTGKAYALVETGSVQKEKFPDLDKALGHQAERGDAVELLGAEEV